MLEGGGWMKLSPVQKEIVETSGNLIVRASAGTGKTFTMVKKLLKKLMIIIHIKWLQQLLLQ